MPLVEASPGRLAGVLVCVDRQERGTGELSAIQEVERDHGVTVTAIVTLDDIVTYLRATGAARRAPRRDAGLPGAVRRR